MIVEYLHLIPNGPLPDINCWTPFRAGVIIEDKRIHCENLEGLKKMLYIYCLLCSGNIMFL